MSTLLSVLKTTGDTANIVFTSFLRCTTATLVHLKVRKCQAAYHREVTAVYFDATSALTKNMYSMFIKCDVPIRSAKLVAQQLRNVDNVIQSGVLDLLPRLKG